MKTKRYVKVIAALAAITIAAGGALCVIPDEAFQQISITAEAAESGTTKSGLKWTLSNNTLSITGNGKIQYGDAPWVDYSDEIEKIIIGDGVTEIGYNSAYGQVFRGDTYKYLEKVTIYSSVKSMYKAFSGCKSLESVVIAKSSYADDDGMEISSYAFNDCANLTSVTFEGNVTVIGSYAFNGCSNLSSITLPDNLKEIGGSAFKNTPLQTINIPDGVTYLGGFVFEGCSRLKSVTMYNTITSMGSMYNDSIFAGLTSLTDVTILDSKKYPDSVGVIGRAAFRNDTNLKNVTISGDISDIEYAAFSGCSAIESIVLPEGLTSIGNYAFEKCTALEKINIPESAASIGSYAFQNCTSLEKMILPKNVTSIGSYAFNYCTSLKSIDILGNLGENMGGHVFYGCSALENVSFAYGIRTISSNAFEKCISLKSIVLPNSIRTINSYAFQNCTELESITFPIKVTDIGRNAFYGCSSLKTIDIPGKIVTVNSDTFNGCSSLVNVILPEGITTISSSAFAKCTGIERISLPESLSSISNSAFSNCGGITHIHIPDYRTYDYYAGIGGLPSVPSYYYPGGCGDEDCPLTVMADKKTEITDPETDVTVKGIDGTEFDSDVVLDVQKESSSDIVITGETVAVAYNITMKKGNDVIYPNGTVRITIPVADEVDGASAKIYRRENDGTYTEMDTVYDPGNNTLSFETDYLSIYVITEVDAIPGDINRDGEFDMDDVIDLARSVLFTAPGSDNPYLSVADLDNSGEIDMDDVILLARKLIMG